jgi:predicted permease
MSGFFLKLWRRRRLERDLEAEMAFHKEMAAAGGNQIPYGNSTVIREEALQLWRFNFVENLWRDLLYAVRGLRRSPALVVSALLSLSLGIGANTAIFSLGMEFLFSEPSVTDPSTIVKMRLGGNSHSSVRAYEFVRDSGAFQDVAGEYEESFVNWNDGTETRRVFGIHTTKNYFTMLGVPMAHGRGFSATDSNDVVVLSQRFWRRHFNGDPSVVGRAINLDGRPYTVTGILPAGHRTLIGFGFSPDIYVPYYLDGTILAISARLRPGTTIGEARAAAATVARRMDAEIPERWKYANGIEVDPIEVYAQLAVPKLQVVGLFFGLLLGVVGLVLLIACVNVASLLLARASARRRETAIRLALGSGKARLIQQFLVESLALSILGAALGLALARTVVGALAAVELPVPVPIRLQAGLDWRVGLYAAFLTVVATVACGLLPALQSVKESIVSDFRREGKQRLRRALVVAQIAVSVVVLTTGLLFVRNLMLSNAISPGFDVTRTIRAEVNLPPLGYGDPARTRLFVTSALRKLEAIPGIEKVAVARTLPFSDGATQSSGLRFTDNGEQVNARFNWNIVSGAYFEAMGIPLLGGRTFREREPGERVVIVNRTFIQRYLGKRSPIGAVFLWGPEGKTPYEIIGVVDNTKSFTIGEDDAPQMYEAYEQSTGARSRYQFVLRSATAPSLQLPAVRQALRTVEPAAGVEVATLYASIGLAFLPSQIGALLLGSLGALGLLLAAVGLYGVMVYMVARRTSEIGVRMAIGAGRSAISRMVFADAGRLVAVGLAAGLFLAVFVTKPLAMFLVPGLEPTDPATFGAVVIVLGLTGVVACWGPVWRAASVDPMRCLRYE